MVPTMRGSIVVATTATIARTTRVIDSTTIVTRTGLNNTIICGATLFMAYQNTQGHMSAGTAGMTLTYAGSL